MHIRFFSFIPAVISAVLFALPVVALSAAKQVPTEAADLFAPTKVWTVHLRFTSEEWAALEPKGGAGPFGVPGQAGGPRRLGPAMLLAPAFLKDGDVNQDGNLSDEEFRALGERWFSAWDKDNRGELTAEQLGARLNAAFAPPAGGPPTPLQRGSFLQGAEGKRNGLASAMGIEFKYVHADLEFEGEPFADIAVRYKGNGTFMQSRGSLKRSLKIDLNKYVKGQKLAGLTTLNLHSNVTDASAMNEVLAFRLYRDAGVPAPRTAYARVFVTVPGKDEREYLGLYSLVEDLDTRFAEETFWHEERRDLQAGDTELV